jgi:hypothetical protein
MNTQDHSPSISSSSFLSLDLARLRAARVALDLRILALKRVLRVRWEAPMAAEQRALLQYKHEATELCILRAWQRGRWHLVDHERCAEVAARLAPAFSHAAEAAA